MSKPRARIACAEQNSFEARVSSHRRHARWPLLDGHRPLLCLRCRIGNRSSRLPSGTTQSDNETRVDQMEGYLADPAQEQRQSLTVSQRTFFRTAIPQIDSYTNSATQRDT